MAYQPMPGHFCDINKQDSKRDSRRWLKSSGGSPSTKPPVHDLQITRHRKGVTQTMYKPSVYQNSLQAVAFPQHLSGYKDPLDYSHKSDKTATTEHMAPLMTSLSSSEMECQLMPEGSLESR